MTLTKQDYDILSAPFEASEHEFRKGGGGTMLCYIREDVITPRIVEVDPAFELTEPLVIEDIESNISVKIGLTIKGVTRWGIGTSARDTQTKEPTKSAVTDAYTRVARLFGIGLYLKGLQGNKSVTDEQSLARWLREQFGKASAPQRPQPQVQMQPKPQPVTQVDESAWDEATWKRNVFAVTKFMYTDADGKYVEQRHSASLKKRMEDTGDFGIRYGMTLYEVINHVMKYRALNDMFLDSSDYPKIFGSTLEAYVDKHSAEEAWKRLNQYYAAQLEPAKPKAS